KMTDEINTLQTKSKELEKIEEIFLNACWQSKKKYEEDFKEIFIGHNTKNSFKDKIIEQFQNDNSQLLSYEELKTKKELIFSDNLSKEEIISEINFFELLELEKHRILSENIVGKKDVDIARMIEQLGNSDWVRQGKNYLDQNDEHCPFCQQNVDEEFIKQLESYFDASYNKQIDKLDQFSEKYSSLLREVKAKINKILDRKSENFNYEILVQKWSTLESKIEKNIDKIKTKQKEPSTPTNLDLLEDVFTDINNTIKELNREIGNHNAMVDNISEERENLKSQVWAFICRGKLAKEYGAYRENKKKVGIVINNSQTIIDDFKERDEEKSTKLQNLEEKVTSIIPTINFINNFLESFCFSGFLLNESENQGYYKLVRPDGEEVGNTLSEGEKNFVAFLYFFYLIKGSDSQEEISENRIVVFDDPVSSLDNDILFVVSNLIKEIFYKIRKESSSLIKQVFVLTHNVYFHKEISFDNKRKKDRLRNDETFWIVRKSVECSKVDSCNSNPIKNSYELIWDLIKTENDNKQLIPNTMRRILDHYFKIIGQLDIRKIIKGFQGDEKIICSSLISWANDGSHFSEDDLYMHINDDQLIGKYKKVFKDIFKKSGHIAHYNMMMKIEQANNHST
ncbi:MAG: AAA family ATPase, partial [Halobacteriovoraceae bacterium]|nr:AAA family ATPase [Halobacteriovoraceae bacterium]